MAGHSGYTIHFEEAQQAATQLEQILDEFKSEMESIKRNREELLSEANWQGPNKERFKSEFSEYEVAITSLYNNGYECLEAFNRIISTYAQAEQ